MDDRNLHIARERERGRDDRLKRQNWNNKTRSRIGGYGLMVVSTSRLG